MTAEDIRRLYWASPFEPFELKLKGGRNLLVEKREHLSISVTGDRIAIAPRIEDLEIIDLADINAVRPLSISGSTNAGSP